MTTITVICPNGVREGQPISITHPHTQQMLQVLVPRGVVAGQQFQVQLPPALPPTQVAVGVPISSPGYGATPPGYGAPPPYAGSGGAQGHCAPPAHGGYGAPPDIRTNKAMWFAHFDRDHSGGLDQRELIAALIATFDVQDPARQADLAKAVGACWSMFDYDINGIVDRQEFLRPDGLADMIIANVRYP